MIEVTHENMGDHELEEESQQAIRIRNIIDFNRQNLSGEILLDGGPAEAIGGRQTLQYNLQTSLLKIDQIDQDIEKYLEMNILNPDWTFAARHGQATRPGRIDEENGKEQCICCMKRINKMPIPLCQNSKQLQFLGLGFPLYYVFLKYVIIIMVLQIFNYAGIDIYFAFIENEPFCIGHAQKIIDGEAIHCSSFLVLLSNINSTLTTVQLILRGSSYLTLVASLIYVRDAFTKTWKYYTERSPTYGTFTVLIEHLPSKEVLSGKPVGDRLRAFFQDQTIFANTPVVASINLVGELEELMGMEEEKKMMLHELGSIRKKIKGIKRVGDYVEEVDELKNDRKDKKAKIRELYGEIQREKNRLKRLIAIEDINCEKAFVSFQTEQEKAAVLKTVLTEEQLTKHFTEAGREIEIVQSPQPGEINWGAISIGDSTKRKRRFLSWLFFVLILGMLTTGILFIFRETVHQVQISVDTTAAAVIFCYLIGIVLFNKFVLTYIVHLLVDFQKHKNGENYQYSFMLKYAIGLFFGTAVLTIIVQGFLHTNVYEEKFGIAEEESIMFFFTAFLVNLIWLVNPWYLWKVLKRKWLQDSPYITQQEANALMEDPEYIMGKRYGQIMEDLWFTFLYMNLVPLGSVLTCVGFCLFYWIDKYNLLRKSSIIENVSANLCMRALSLLQLVLIFKPLGQIIFDYLVRNSWHVVSVVELGFGVLYLVLPTSRILDFFHNEKFHFTQITYEQLSSRNYSGYQMFNPLTKEDALKRHFQKIEQSELSQNRASKRSRKPSLIGSQDPTRESKNRIARPHEAGLVRKKKLGPSQVAGGKSVPPSIPSKSEV